MPTSCEHRALRALKAKWSAADVAVDAKRSSAYQTAGARVEGWRAKRSAAHATVDANQEANCQRLQTQWQTKVERVAAWRVKTEAARQQRASEVAAVRHAAKGRLSGQLAERSDRLETAQQLQETRRLKLEVRGEL